MPNTSPRVVDFSDLSGQVFDADGFSRTVNRAFVTASASGNTALVSAQSGYRIRVLSVTIVCLLAVTVKFQSNTTDISSGLFFGDNGGISVPYNQHGIFQTSAGEALNINLGISTSVGCNITWCLAL